jgi:hypothetical protein
VHVTNVVVAPLSRAAIEHYALAVRRMLGIGEHQAVDMLQIIEHVLPRVWDDFVYEYVTAGGLGGAEATTSMTERTIRITEPVYEATRRGHPRYLFTLAHELGHLLLHTGKQTSLARGEKVKAFLDPEWQANTFASAFLMPESGIRACDSISHVMRKYGVSRPAAEIRANTLGLSLPFLPASIMKKGH